jgi:putative ABC transport system substrate-binding protein
VGKRLQFLRQIAPAMTGAAYLRSERTGSDTDALYRSLVAAASGFPLSDLVAQTAADIEPLIDGFVRQPNGGLIVAFDAFTTTYAALIVSLAAKYRVPTVYPLNLFSETGGLISYGFDQLESFRRAAGYVDRILRGAKPSELPVQEPTRFQLIVNGKTAAALGLEVPQLLLAQADEVIE